MSGWRCLVVGGGPAGYQAASTAARLGAKVTVVERDVIGGAANVWECVPSKTMIAAAAHGSTGVDVLRARVSAAAGTVHQVVRDGLAGQGVELLSGSAVFSSARTARVTGPNGDVRLVTFDVAVIAVGCRQTIPDWCQPDGERVLATRDCYPPPVMPDSVAIIGSGVTGVEFAHMFSAFGSDVSLLVSRQQVLPGRDPEVAGVLEDEFARRGVTLLKGARAERVNRTADGVEVVCADGRTVRVSHAVLAIGSTPNTNGLGLAAAGVDVDQAGYVIVDGHGRTSQQNVFAAGDVTGAMPLASVAAMQGRRAAECALGVCTLKGPHVELGEVASAIFSVPEVADVGLMDVEAFASGRKVRVTKVPFAATARAVIERDTAGFVKIVSDPATGVVLGGSIVGHGASELIAVLALAVKSRLQVSDIAGSLFVHPSLGEALLDAAD